MDSVLAWSQWRAEQLARHGTSPGSVATYPSLLFRFLTETGRKPVEDYTWDDVYGFIRTRALSPFERRHYPRAADSFFFWCMAHSLLVDRATRKERPRDQWARLRGWLSRIAAAILTPETGTLMLPTPSLVPVHDTGLRPRRRQSGSRFGSVARLISVIVVVFGIEAAVALWVVLRFRQ
jgi:hypothetical protein